MVLRCAHQRRPTGAQWSTGGPGYIENEDTPASAAANMATVHLSMDVAYKHFLIMGGESRATRRRGPSMVVLSSHASAEPSTCAPSLSGRRGLLRRDRLVHRPPSQGERTGLGYCLVSVLIQSAVEVLEFEGLAMTL